MNDALISDVQAGFTQLADQLRALLISSAPDQCLARLEQPIPMINLKGWLSHQTGAKKAYWRDRERECERAALGRTWTRELYCRDDIEPAFQKARQLLDGLPADTGAQCFSYLSFSDHDSQTWSSFGYGTVFLPLLECVETRRGTTLAINLYANSEDAWYKCIQQALALLANIQFRQTLRNDFFQLQEPVYHPQRQKWQSLMSQALHSFSHHEMDKVVLSREAVYGYRGHLSPWYLLQCWQKANSQSYGFLFEGDNNEIFMGCSPEKLIKRQGNIITTEALAGTTRRGASRDEDFQLEVLLMNDRKNIHENQLVLNDIREKLSNLCRSLESDRSHSILKLKTIQHLRYLIRGVLKNKISDGQLINALHPTPAVGGSPRAVACQFIDRHEPYNRGLYAGACGVVGIERSEFCVSIRSARLTPDSITLFAGAGIVQGSNSQDEWQELNNKIATILDIVQRLQSKPLIEESFLDVLCFGQV
ncbi:hypothetical protein ACH42_11400 [Endozoicomonas sp. (ex Bugula neritina AB1)]|nr:hypothetical protein ACH42_11400 [Endozoicomonas sp. (ex Bugula neritina AB1)]